MACDRAWSESYVIRWRGTRAWLREKGRERLQKGSEKVDTSSGNGRDKVGCYG